MELLVIKLSSTLCDAPTHSQITPYLQLSRRIQARGPPVLVKLLDVCHPRT